MAYVFSQLNQAMQPPDNANIFAPAAPAQAQQGQSQAGPIIGGQGGESAVGTGGSSGASSASNGMGAAKDVGINQTQAPVDQSQILQKQASDAPSFLGDVKSWQSGVKDQLNQEASAYNDTQNAKLPGNLSANIVNQAQYGGDAYSQVANRLNQAAPTVDPYSTKINLNNDAEQALNSPALMQQYLQRQGGAGYSSGMAKLDQMLLGGNKAFQNNKAEVLQNQSDLANQLKQQSANLSGQVQGKLSDAFNQGTSELRSSLSGQQAAIEAGAETRANAENKNRAANRVQPDYKLILQHQADDLQKAIGDNPDLAPYLPNTHIDPNQFYSAGADVSAADAINADESARYTQLNNLLGAGANPYAKAGSFGPAENFNDAAYIEALKAHTLKIPTPPPTPPPTPSPPPPPAPGPQAPAPIADSAGAGSPIQFTPDMWAPVFTGDFTNTDTGLLPGQGYIQQQVGNVIGGLKSAAAGGGLFGLTDDPNQRFSGINQAISQGRK